MEGEWRVVRTVLGDAGPVAAVPEGSWGPKEADGLLPEGGAWHDPPAEQMDDHLIPAAW